MEEMGLSFIKSWSTKEGINSLNEIFEWITEKNKNTHVKILKNSLEECSLWKYNNEDGEIVNNNSSFFKIKGIKTYNGEICISEQPIIIQEEIGYLGIICKKINGVLHFLMQAKIEPGNINKIQISPTIQATKSNFTQQHGGKKPNYLDYFINAQEYDIIVDQIQSEQSSRFFKKRNRNIIINIGNIDIEVLPSYKWMTLGQIKELMKVNNIVNMDTRTVLSCIPFSLSKVKYDEISEYFENKSLARSLFNNDVIDITKIYNYINDYKMFNDEKNILVPLHCLGNWKMHNNEFVCKKPYNFKIIFCDISIEGREVKKWNQPLFEALGIATFGLIMKKINGKMMFLVKANHEIGSFDKIELGPSIQMEPIRRNNDDIINFFSEKIKNESCVKYDVMLSEEGGRFYHEQNRNVIIEIPSNELNDIPKGYFWLDYRTINLLQQINNTINIQLRNLISLLEV